MKLREEKRQQENTKRQNREFLGEDIYTLFYAWCNAFNDANNVNNYTLFKDFLKTENITLNKTQENYLIEKYFKG